MIDGEHAMGPRLIVMLTQNDFTVSDAAAIFEACKDTQAEFWGMKECGKTTFLEVVAYTEAEGLEGARSRRRAGAVQCGHFRQFQFH